MGWKRATKLCERNLTTWMNYLLQRCQKQRLSGGWGRDSNPLIDVHLRGAFGFLLLGWGVGSLRPALRGVRPRVGNSNLGLGLSQKRMTEVNDLILLLQDLRARQDRIHILRPLGLPRDLVFQPLLNGGCLLHDCLLVLLVDVAVFLVSRRSV